MIVDDATDEYIKGHGKHAQIPVKDARVSICGTLGPPCPRRLVGDLTLTESDAGHGSPAVWRVWEK